MAFCGLDWIGLDISFARLLWDWDGIGKGLWNGIWIGLYLWYGDLRWMKDTRNMCHDGLIYDGRTTNDFAMYLSQRRWHFQRLAKHNQEPSIFSINFFHSRQTTKSSANNPWHRQDQTENHSLVVEESHNNSQRQTSSSIQTYTKPRRWLYEK